ncbi:hypothetical protein QBC34DRAFT_461750 [Podospora aff. communis PSN243]|uniref:NACHT domain-containing protein n=1 Tax=Podospora aff. communis PSN243 TaxID=3040156 RepID=A0AAV9GUN2_9PEZI|nr:hypothetical protein QBC34DRAFT_461750 [Podospora aff. communis PSN243]
MKNYIALAILALAGNALGQGTRVDCGPWQSLCTGPLYNCNKCDFLGQVVCDNPSTLFCNNLEICKKVCDRGRRGRHTTPWQRHPAKTMDPLSALAIATAAAQFLEFGNNLITGTFERYQAAAGATENHVNIAAAASRLRELTDNLQLPAQEPPATPDIQVNRQQARQLENIANTCRHAAEQLLVLITELQTTGRHKLLESLVATAKAIRKEKKVQQLHQKLLSAQSELSLCLVSLVYEKQRATAHRDEVRQSNILVALDDLLEQSRDFELRGSETLSSLTRLLKSLVHRLDRQTKDDQENGAIIEDTRRTMMRLPEEAQARQSQLRIVQSLTDPVMKMRENTIPEAYAETYRWMLQPSHSSEYSDVRFYEWLTDGRGVFWIAGKPGCGKSTLMKFLHSDQPTQAALRKWTGRKRLVVGGHFFWIAGYELQRSQEGLLRSLLCTILTECPSLIPTIVQDRWGHSPLKHGHPWTRKELLDSLGRFSRMSISDTKFCFFIDALDEYNGNHDELAGIIAALCKNNNIKICLSSREWPVFDYYFGENRNEESLAVRKIRLQHYTRKDIGRYTESRLEHNPRYQRLRAVEVERSLSRQKDSLERLRRLPTDLEPFFQRMIERVEPVYHGQCAQILQLLLAARRPIPARQFDFIAGDPTFGIQESVTLLPESDETRVVQLKARCADLIEFVSRDETWKFGPDVTFMHRTVRDFLMTHPIQTFLVAKLPAMFNVHSYMLQALVSQTRLAEREMELQLMADEDCLTISREIAHHVRTLEATSATHWCDLIDTLLPRIPFVALAWTKVTVPAFSNWAFSNWPTPGDRVAILLFAISEGLHAFVSRQLDASPRYLKSLPSEFPLVYCALWDVLDRQPDRELEAEHVDAILKTLRVVLAHGASPNQTLTIGGTPWTHLMVTIKRVRESETNLCADIVATLIEAGACEHVYDAETKLPLNEFSPLKQRKLAFIQESAAPPAEVLDRTDKTQLRKEMNI